MAAWRPGHPNPILRRLPPRQWPEIARFSSMTAIAASATAGCNSFSSTKKTTSSGLPPYRARSARRHWSDSRSYRASIPLFGLPTQTSIEIRMSVCALVRRLPPQFIFPFLGHSSDWVASSRVQYEIGSTTTWRRTDIGSPHRRCVSCRLRKIESASSTSHDGTQII